MGEREGWTTSWVAAPGVPHSVRAGPGFARSALEPTAQAAIKAVQAQSAGAKHGVFRLYQNRFYPGILRLRLRSKTKTPVEVRYVARLGGTDCNLVFAYFHSHPRAPRRLKGVFSPNPLSFYDIAQGSLYSLPHEPTTLGECPAGLEQAVGKI